VHYFDFSEATREALHPSSETVSSWMFEPLPSACAHALPMRSAPSKFIRMGLVCRCCVAG
jgi:hypothetical protein